MEQKKNVVKFLLCGLMAFELSGCGYLMHANRRGQSGGQIDLTIAILDGLGLLLFLVPGVVAYIVDFTTGCIYLPGTFGGVPLVGPEMKKISFDPKKYTPELIEQIIFNETGSRVDLSDSSVQVTKVKSVKDMQFQLTLVSVGLRPVLVAAIETR